MKRKLHGRSSIKEVALKFLNIAKFLKMLILKNICEQLLLKLFNFFFNILRACIIISL